ncbi:MAG: aminopeptidase P family protein [Desulfarculaceae bacterium]|nr:aminopeptidase P family protein [Desulfarculaceae bacterium]MCF8064276.1 aminopeptidase P family protein [Desulfarculaceae bacterium]MCF8098067.1 aminopeptidase P family protein [Desulfarculaceae bacterium]MCF8123116.1 aminopeptidase P family protein [Desulfarculaceae bacterium]
MIKTRLAALRRLLEQQGLDALLVTLPANRRYLSGFSPDDGQWGESSGCLLISQTAALMLTDFRYELTARAQAPYFETLIYHQGLAPLVAMIAPELGLKNLAYESEAMLDSWRQRLVQHLPGVELKPTLGLVSKLRVKKNSAEIKALSASLALMEKVLDQTLAGELVGRREREVALSIARAVEDAGAEGVSFPPTVASGPNGAEPHAESGERVIERGDPIVFDVGAKLNGYCSDISRTVVAGGLEAADERFAQIYGTTLAAKNKAYDEIMPGITGGEADGIAREVIDQAGFGARFGHSLGHGVGLATHEDPRVGPRADDILEPGMVFTIEPGIYLPGWGGVRLEDMVLLTGEGCMRLGNLDRFYDIA